MALGDIAYAYDAVGNRTARRTTLGRTTTDESYDYDAFSNRLLSVASTGGRRGGGAIRELSYTDTGHAATDGKDGRALAYDYDQADRLVAVRDGGVEIAAYTHNAMGQRVAKDTAAGTVHYVYDTAGRLIAEHDGVTGAVIAEYVWLGDAPLAYVRDGQTYWVHSDHLGTPQLLTDGAGRIAWSAIHRPFGETAHVGGQVTFNLRFPGQYFDAETGLHYNYFRTYDPTSGRYLESDPIGLSGGWNTYAYVGGNPVMYVDPEGQAVRGQWIGNSPRFGDFEIVNHGSGWGLSWSWWGYVGVYNLYREAKVNIYVDVRCLDEGCSSREWEEHYVIPYSTGKKTLPIGPNLYATAAGLAARNPLVTVGVNIALIYVRLDYQFESIYQEHGLKARFALAMLMAYGPSQICEKGLPPLPL